MRIAITGATGFIGGHVCAAAIRKGHDVVALVRSADKLAKAMDAMSVESPRPVVGDMADASALAEAMSGADAVVHCAAIVSLDPKEADEMVSANEAGARAVVTAATAAGAKRIVYLSSSSALFDRSRRPITVDDPPTSLDFAYARAKSRAERTVRELAAEGAPVSIVYPSAVIGPPAGSAFGEAGEGMAGFLTSGVMPTRDAALSIVDVRDLTEVIIALCESPSPPDRVMCTGTMLEMTELATLYRSLTGRRFPILPVPAAALRATGRAVDAVRARVSFDSPVTGEGMTVLTEWKGAVDTDLESLGVVVRPVEHTLSDTMLAWRDAGLVSNRQIGRLSQAG